MTQPNQHRDSNTRTHTADTRNPDWEKYEPEGHGRTDEQIRADIHEALFGKDAPDDAKLSVSVGDGLVTLGGQVESEAECKRIVERVRSIPSVKDVRNELRVGS